MAFAAQTVGGSARSWLQFRDDQCVDVEPWDDHTDASFGRLQRKFVTVGLLRRFHDPVAGAELHSDVVDWHGFLTQGYVVLGQGESQIDRMLNDARSSRFCDNFASQWLQLDRLITSIPDPNKFPYFYFDGYRTSMHMLSEPLLLFETVYIENRSIIELLDPKFTWQSDMLQSNYEGHSRAPTQDQVQVFKRVPLDDPRRGGVITNAAVMTMTSTATRTQPITRGAWVNAVIFNDPPEPPPADVLPLPEVDKEELANLTIPPVDSPALDGITLKATAGDDQLRTVLKRVAMSEPFLHKK